MARPTLDLGRLGPYAYRLALTAIATRPAAEPFTQEAITIAEGCLDAPSLVPLGGAIKTFDSHQYPIVSHFNDRDA